MTDQALKPDLSVVDCQIPECRAGKRSSLATCSLSIPISPKFPNYVRKRTPNVRFLHHKNPVLPTHYIDYQCIILFGTVIVVLIKQKL